ncbi:MAG: alpha/beta hydrolase [Chloroflexi bacterium]|nr:alpha/beta hydrolase [Chloroflexota bacterium]
MTSWTAEDGTPINFELYGGREPGKPNLLLLPGLLGTIQGQWRQFLKPLSESYRVILVDLRGHGRSENNADTLNAEQMMNDLFGVIDSLNVQSCHVAGYSIGGYLGLMMALNQSRRIETLLMHATKFYWAEDAVTKMQAQLNPDFIAEKVPAYANSLMKEHGARQWRDLVRQASELVHSLSKNGLTERTVANIQCPTIISVGDSDEMVPLPEAYRLSKKMPHAGLIVLPGVRHPFPTVKLVPLLPMMLHHHQSSTGGLR